MKLNISEKRKRFLIFSSFSLLSVSILSIVIGFTAWQFGGKNNYSNNEDPINAGAGTITNFDDTLSFFAIEGSSIPGSSLSYKTHTSTEYKTSLDSSSQSEIISSSETSQNYFTSSSISAILELDKTSSTFEGLYYDDPIYNTLSIDFSVYEFVNAIVAPDTSVTSDTILNWSPTTVNDLDHLEGKMKIYKKNVTEVISSSSSSEETSSTYIEEYIDVTEESSSFSSGESVYLKLYPYGEGVSLKEGDLAPKVYANDIECQSILSPSQFVDEGDAYWYSFAKTDYATSISVCWNLTEDYLFFLDTDMPSSIRPYNLPDYEFELERSINYPHKWYIPLKSKKEMSLYSLFNYDHSYLSSSDKKIPAEFMFNFNDPNEGYNPLLDGEYDIFTYLNRHRESYFYLSFDVISLEEKALNEVVNNSEVAA